MILDNWHKYDNWQRNQAALKGDAANDDREGGGRSIEEDHGIQDEISRLKEMDPFVADQIADPMPSEDFAMVLSSLASALTCDVLTDSPILGSSRSARIDENGLEMSLVSVLSCHALDGPPPSDENEAYTRV